ncbi:MAG: c-type cytochrome [Aestuariivirga sp.]
MKVALMLAAALFAVPAAAMAGDAAAGKKLMVKCVVCHGKDGVSKNPEAPNLSGQIERYLVKSLKAYKSGERPDKQMSLIAKPLKDNEIEDLAAYYASIKVTVEMPQ